MEEVVQLVTRWAEFRKVYAERDHRGVPSDSNWQKGTMALLRLSI